MVTEILTVDEIAVYLKSAEKTIYKLAAKNKFRLSVQVNFGVSKNIA